MMDSVNHIKLRVERSTAPGVLRAILSSIFFQRSLDAIEPTTVDILDTHVAVPSTALMSVPAGAVGKAAGAALSIETGIQREISTKVFEFTRTFVDTRASGGEVAVVFMQRKNRKGWFAVTEALVPWEEHLITLTFVTRATQNPLPGALLQVLTFCAKHSASVPPLLGTPDQSNLSHEIIISPPPPSEFFSPPPRPPERLYTPRPPQDTTTTTTTATATADLVPVIPPVPLSARSPGYERHSSSPMTAISDAGTSAMGYLGQAKDGLLAKARWRTLGGQS
ncbi:hypothetical protein CspeluHIS016_0113500 [Cutaneotrichosporon spelunceum]|uniref:Autophagy-related protein 101 n=1 Tax=Cutaneotrichosporon spelunceum TaxID=1672016 RepID=A0AAD3TQA8_9TREE|nr:hypothetical protein CspeluHIS016_0113500 [Cutaneotrichosporon spelunceum]